VGFPVDLVTVHLSLEGLLNLAGGSAEVEEALALGHVLDGETLRLEPRTDLGDVGIGKAEMGAEILGRDPLVIVCRAAILLLI
jgi:hypothetical protein